MCVTSAESSLGFSCQYRNCEPDRTPARPAAGKGQAVVLPSKIL